MDAHRHSLGWSRGVGLLGLIGLLGWGMATPQASESSRHATRQVPYGQLPLSFEANQGQADGQVQFWPVAKAIPSS